MSEEPQKESPAGDPPAEDGRIISDEEVNALLSGVKDGSVSTAGDAAAPGEVRAYDLCGEDRVVPGRLPGLALINERLVSRFRKSLYGLLRRDVEITAGSVDTLRFAEYVNTLPTPSSLNLVRAEPLAGTALVVLEPALVFALVDGFFGGRGEAAATGAQREFTPTETHFVGSFLERLFADLEEAWAPVAPLKLSCVKSEINPHFANIAGRTDTLLVSTFELQFADGGGVLHLVLPAAMLDTVRERLENGVPPEGEVDRAAWVAAISARLQETEVELRSVFTETVISFRELLGLQPGDVIPIEMPRTVTLCAGEAGLYRGKFGISRGYNAMKMIEPIPPGADTTKR